MTTPTTKQEVLALRRAFEQGVDTLYFHRGIPNTADAELARGEARSRAASYYPLPKITRPRVVSDPEPGYDQKWRVKDGVLEFNGHTGWREAHGCSASGSYGTCLFPTPARIMLWADLLANPTETVDDEG